jgi:hypothetical protein
MFRHFKEKNKNFIINFKKRNSWTQVPGFFFNKKVILDYYFCLKSGPVFLFQMFIIAPLPLPRDIKLLWGMYMILSHYCIIIDISCKLRIYIESLRWWKYDVIYDFRIKTRFGSSLPPVVCRRAHVLFTSSCL